MFIRKFEAFKQFGSGSVGWIRFLVTAGSHFVERASASSGRILALCFENLDASWSAGALVRFYLNTLYALIRKPIRTRIGIGVEAIGKEPSA
ncbi:MAG: hypothetical protein EXS30_10995 [Pedosphaera sp.]|nr:hypothetical protein [Pedosphaera sp.]